MQNKIILITGASSGVGKAMTEHLSTNNTVLALARRIDRMKELYQENKNIFPYQVDINNSAELDKTLKQIRQDNRVPSIIINCAGVMKIKNMMDLNNEEIMTSININAIAPFTIIRYFLPFMKENNYGRIVNITSGAPMNCFSNVGAYSASKGVLNILTRTLAKELAESNITVNLMSPGPVKSEMAPDALLEPEICLPTLDYILSTTDTGKFYWLGYEIPQVPDLGNIDWMNGIGSDKLIKLW